MKAADILNRESFETSWHACVVNEGIDVSNKLLETCLSKCMSMIVCVGKGAVNSQQCARDRKSVVVEGF